MENTDREIKGPTIQQDIYFYPDVQPVDAKHPENRKTRGKTVGADRAVTSNRILENGSGAARPVARTIKYQLLL
jgi:hypothetical protein